MPFGVFLLLLFHALGIWLSRQHAQGVALIDEVVKSVGGDIMEHDIESVVVDECGIAKPVCDGVGFRGCLDEECVGGIEVESFNLRQLSVAGGEIECHPVGERTLRLQEIAVGKSFGESTENDVVGGEMCVSYAVYRLYVQRVAPQGILTDVGI